MTGRAIIQGDYHTVRHVPSRKVVQVVIEIPQEQMALWMEMFGSPGEGTQVAIARLAEKSGPVIDRPVADRGGSRHWSELSYAEQAGIRCGDPDFWAYCGQLNMQDTVDYVRHRCGVRTRSDLIPGTPAGNRWEKLDTAYRQYLSNTSGRQEDAA